MDIVGISISLASAMQWFRYLLGKFLLVLRIQQDSRLTPHYEEPFALEISKVTMVAMGLSDLIVQPRHFFLEIS